MQARELQFRPDDYESFSIDSWSYDPTKAQLKLDYSLDDQLSFSEIFVFGSGPLPVPPGLELAFNCACNLLHLIAGVSYYKSAVPPKITVKSQELDPQTSDFLTQVYKNGLAEFAYRNRLDLNQLKFPATIPQSKNLRTPCKLNSGIVVPIGGGKDSLVTVELLKQSGLLFKTFVLGDFELIDQLLANLNLPSIKIGRKIDSKLFELNRLGAYNGHVPISAIIAACLPVAGILHGFDTAVLSNERSADLPNLVVGDCQVNHQYSKTLEFEEAFRKNLDRSLGGAFRYFSLLRPLSELSIAQIFAQNSAYDTLFSSCNRNFSLTSEVNRRWCLECPKCYSTFICLAPFCSPERMCKIFGANLLEQSSAIELIEELIGVRGIKPFECVIDSGEARAAFQRLTQLPEWQEFPVVRWFKDLQLTQILDFASLLKPEGSHFIPKEFQNLIYANQRAE